MANRRVEMVVREVKREELSRSQDSSVFVGHHDRTGAGAVRGKSWTRQTLGDAWDATNSDDLCGTPWQMVALELILTKTVTSDKEGTGPPMPKFVVEIFP